MSSDHLGRRALTLGIVGFIAALAGRATADTVADTKAAEVIAINVLIEPDAASQTQARALNARLRESAPERFALDESHVPHISLLHRYVRRRDLERVYAAVSEVVASRPAFPWQLTAQGIEAGTWGSDVMVSIGVRKTPELENLQRELVRAVRPYTVENADARAFLRTPGSAEINSQTIEYVRDFVPKRIGEAFKPHITVGLTTAELARPLQNEGFPETRFNAVRVAIYQLGNDGTARQRLRP